MVVSVFFLSLIYFKYSLAAIQAGPDVLASQYALTTSTSMPFPTATMSTNDTESYLNSWGLGKGHIQDGPQNLRFVDDPFPNSPPPGTNSSATSPTGPVLEVTYPKGSYSHDTGGAQFYTLWNSTDGSTFNSMMVKYQIAFDRDFDWVKGGKLPGLRGGLDSSGCSGGSKSDGLQCVSFRMMWRKAGAGEVYAYTPTTDGLCSRPDIMCNSDYGISIDRGAFAFVSGQWMSITMLVLLNDPSTEPNGYIAIFFNDELAIVQSGLPMRRAGNVSLNGFYFSTFFGGSDSSWSTSETTHTYFRNIQLWGSSAASNDSYVNDASTRKPTTTLALLLLTLVMGSLFCI